MALLFLLAFQALELGRPFWFDEVFTLGAAGVFPALDWPAITGDVHPPGHIVLASLGRWLASGALEGARLPNLLAWPVGALAAWRLGRILGWRRTCLALCLILATAFTPVFLWEARTYFLLMALSLLGHSLVLGPQNRGTALALAALAPAMACLHFFGTAMGGALLLTALWQAAPAERWPLLGGGVLSLALTFGWLLGPANIGGALGGGFYVTNDPWLPIDMLGALGPAVALSAGTALKGDRARWRTARRALVPSAILLATVAAISVLVPVITPRNLSVLVPGVAVFAAVWIDERMLDGLTRRPILPAMVLGALALYAVLATGQRQAPDWVMARSHTPSCAGVPLYWITPGVVPGYAEALWGGGITRPQRPFSSLGDTFEAEAYASCEVVAAGFHEAYPPAMVRDALAEVDPRLALSVAPPQGVLPEETVTDGFVVTLGP